jgi:Fe-S cluster assembly protein SufD
MDAKIFFKEIYEHQEKGASNLKSFQQKNWDAFSELGLPAIKHEEWKYTKVRNLFKDGLIYDQQASSINKDALSNFILPGTEKANHVFFVNGIYQPELTEISDSTDVLVIKTLEAASGDEDAAFVDAYLGGSYGYNSDGINALNASFSSGGAFIKVRKGAVLTHPVVIHHIADAQAGLRFSQPRILISIESLSQSTIIETYNRIGTNESLTNEVMEICVEKEANLRYIKIQNEGADANHTGTTHIRQLAKAVTHAVTITLSGSVVRNNLNMVMDGEFGESHMFGLYLLDGKTQADNHTIVDNAMPNCFSNELYKGIMDGSSSGIFNGKIFVRKDAQKTNAYQTNKNILMSENSSANTKPQLEIFADDVKCSHGCTIGKLDDDALFYLRARGISEQNAKALLLHAFAADILQQIEIEPLREYIDGLISDRLTLNI